MSSQRPHCQTHELPGYGTGHSTGKSALECSAAILGPWAITISIAAGLPDEPTMNPECTHSILCGLMVKC